MHHLLRRAVAVGSAILGVRDPTLWDGKTCGTGVHMMVARGSSEAAGLGRVAPVVYAIEDAIPGSTIDAIEYPATFADYADSKSAAVDEFRRLIPAFADLCPDTRIVLVGFSQGAHALTDAICGSDSAFLGAHPDLHEEYYASHG